MTSRRLALTLGLLVAALGVAVLAGWWLAIPALKQVVPGLVTMKANTALGLALCGAALVLGCFDRAAWVLLLVASTVIALAGLSLGQDLFGVDFGIDQLLVRDTDA